MQKFLHKDELVLRPATMDDIPQLIQLETAAFSEKHFPLSTKRHFLYCLKRSTCELWVATDGENIIVGYTLIYFRVNTKAARLYSIAVNPHHHGKGIGVLLLTHVEKIAKKRGCVKILLEVREDREKVIAMYAKNGFKKIKMLPQYYPDRGTGIKMVKELNV